MARISDNGPPCRSCQARHYNPFPDTVDISFDDVVLVRDGIWQGKTAEDAATRVLRQPRFSVGLDLKAGPGIGEVYTCDLSLDYVKINADYRS